ncbi:MAG: hypothetical protein HQL83_07385 [Magnetococcales bacterium]|nr:hypothetical protein [Magnetococcales bacterium]MBF0630275.1 hypothetical protein [Magnetococcales bacterium]
MGRFDDGQGIGTLRFSGDEANPCGFAVDPLPRRDFGFNPLRLTQWLLLAWLFVFAGHITEVGADGGSNGPAADEQNFSLRLKSVSSLTEALNRIRKEKNAGKAAEALSERIQQLTMAASELANKGEMVKGRALLDQAYEMAKVGIEQLRQGDILTHEANKDQFKIVPDREDNTTRSSFIEQHFELRLKSVQTLTDAMDRIREAKKVREETEQVSGQIHLLTREAQQLAGRGEFNKGHTLLDRAYAMAKTAIEQMRRGDTLVNEVEGHFLVTKEKRDGDDSSYGEQNFEARLKTVDALTIALDRIIKEKNAGKEVQDASSQVHQYMEEARKLVGAGALDQGRNVLDKAYVIVKANIVQLRHGDVLVKILHFASAEEEYIYELDRNDTYRMLIGLLIEEAFDAMDPMIKKLIIQSAELRRQADQQGKAGHFEQAIKTLEDSTMELIKAIRGSGVNIPG